MFDFDQMACDIVSVAEGVGDAPYGFDFLGNPAQFVAAAVGFVQVCRSELRQILADFTEAVVTIAIRQAAESGAGEQAVFGRGEALQALGAARVCRRPALS